MSSLPYTCHNYKVFGVTICVWQYHDCVYDVYATESEDCLACPIHATTTKQSSTAPTDCVCAAGFQVKCSVSSPAVSYACSTPDLYSYLYCAAM